MSSNTFVLNLLVSFNYLLQVKIKMFYNGTSIAPLHFCWSRKVKGECQWRENRENAEIVFVCNSAPNDQI